MNNYTNYYMMVKDAQNSRISCPELSTAASPA